MSKGLNSHVYCLYPCGKGKSRTLSDFETLRNVRECRCPSQVGSKRRKSEMKKQFFSIKAVLAAWVAAFAVLSCAKEQSTSNGAGGNVFHPTTRRISAAEAKEFGRMVFSAIHASGGEAFSSDGVERTVESVSPIVASDGQVAMYLVSAADSAGYILLSADKESSHRVLAMGPHGTFGVDEIDPDSPFGQYVEGQKDKISADIAQGIHASNAGYQLWEAMASDEWKIELALASPVSGDGATETRGTHYPYEYRPYKAPHYEVCGYKWGQGGGYSMDTPLKYDDKSGKWYHCLAGCPAVAIGLLCSSLKYPASINGMTIDYSNPNVSDYCSTPTSKLLRAIGNNIPGYDWGIDGSGAYKEQILAGLRNIGYSFAQIQSWGSSMAFEWAYSDIQTGCPVLLAGESNKAGHIWIADGYWEAAWRIVRYKLRWFRWVYDCEWTEGQHTFFMNWGWCGDQNGWVDALDWPMYNKKGRQVMFTNLRRPY